MLENNLLSVKNCIKSFIETEQICLNTKNPDFILKLVESSSEMMQEFFISTSSKKPTSSSTTKSSDEEYEKKKQLLLQMLFGFQDIEESVDTSKQVKMHQNLTKVYFDFIRKKIRDFVPKRIHHKMVKLVLDEFENHLQDHVFTPYVINRTIDQVLVEDELTVQDRQRAKMLLDAVNKALQNMIDIQCF